MTTERGNARDGCAANVVAPAVVAADKAARSIDWAAIEADEEEAIEMLLRAV